MKHLFFFLLFILVTISLSAQNFKKVKIYLNDTNDIEILINAGLQFDHYSATKDNAIHLFVSDKEFDALIKTGFKYEVLIEDWFRYYEGMPKLTESEKQTSLLNSKSNYNVTGFGYGSMGGYYTYSEVIANLDSMIARYPNIISQKYSIGTSHEGRTLWAVKISDNPNISEHEPATGFDALVHAREPQSMATLLYFMWYLLENYGSDPAVTYLVNNREIYCVPVFNPDGYEYNRTTNPNGGGMWRKNRRNNGGSYGVDLNRNFSYKWGYDNSGSSSYPPDETYRGPGAFSEPEAQAIRDYVTGKGIKTYFNMHSYQDAILYPWGYINAFTPDSLTYREFASDMAVYNGYSYGNSTQILGYASNGSVRDWLYGEQLLKNKIFGYTIEIGNSSDNFWPPQSRIFPIAQSNVPVNMYQAWVAGEYVALENANFQQQYFNAGDIVSLLPAFRNKGLSSAYNLDISLSSLSQYASVVNGAAIFDSLAARTSALATSPLTIAVSSNAPVEEKIKLLFTVSTQGTIMSTDTVSFIVGVPTYMFIDTTNNPLANWTITAVPAAPKWEATTTSFYSTPNSYTDSKTGSYSSNATVTMKLTNPVDLSAYTNPKLTFWTKYEIESNWDYGQVEISTNNGSTWQPLHGLYTEPGQGSFQPSGEPLYDGIRSTWVQEQISLEGHTSSQVKIKFELKSDGSLQKDGWYVDDIGIMIYTVVPVELRSLAAEVINNKISLTWQTVTELNNSGFQVERQSEGVIDNQWEKVGFVKGSGSTSELHSYSFIDENIEYGKYRYRIKQIDYDGTFRIYGPVEVDYTAVLLYSLEQNYPNPFNPATSIKYTIPKEVNGQSSMVNLKVYDLLGNEIFTLVNEEQTPGVHEVEFDAGKLSSGIYFYTINSGSFTKAMKMMILK
ncbi:MAG: immune inhibitor A [Ignavibacteriaceae bacterium]|nr:immune inhibitor A [Ignavibacteriaceae bacterium]